MKLTLHMELTKVMRNGVRSEEGDAIRNDSNPHLPLADLNGRPKRLVRSCNQFYKESDLKNVVYLRF